MKDDLGNTPTGYTRLGGDREVLVLFDNAYA